MKIREVMTDAVVKIHPEESVAVAARTLTHYNIGVLPVCGYDGNLCGLVTDRDLVTRCLAAGKSPEGTCVKEVMSGSVITARPDMDTGAAAHLMGRQQIRRLPVVENGRLCGMVSLGDLAHREECNPDAADALGEICTNVSKR
ncbi:MAG: CBS domain-containing protein [Oscillospiraceae bacterium]|nr:CBS domain-containing protein [Oscillospiraceae bacterium]